MSETLRLKRARLLRLRDRLDAELAAVERAMQVAGILPLGRPSRQPVITTAEARRAHSAYVLGIRTPEVIAGHRQYDRDLKRQWRARRRAS
jgi:hypothetical protein